MLQTGKSEFCAPSSSALSGHWYSFSSADYPNLTAGSFRYLLADSVHHAGPRSGGVSQAWVCSSLGLPVAPPVEH